MSVVDCSELNQDARESFECTDSQQVRDSISAAHLFIMFGILLLAFLAILVVQQVSKRLVNQKIRSLPRRRLPVDVEINSSSRNALSSRMAETILDQFSRPGSAPTDVVPEVNYAALGWDPGEGIDYNGDGGVQKRPHFRSTIASSMTAIEECCSKNGLRRRKPNESMRAFMRHVVDVLGSAPLPANAGRGDMTFRTACQAYVCMFEEAKYVTPRRFCIYGVRQFTLPEFNAFLDITLRIMKTVKSSTDAAGVSDGHQRGYG